MKLYQRGRRRRLHFDELILQNRRHCQQQEMSRTRSGHHPATSLVLRQCPSHTGHSAEAVVFYGWHLVSMRVSHPTEAMGIFHNADSYSMKESSILAMSIFHSKVS